jgi:hypothetical protein
LSHSLRFLLFAAGLLAATATPADDVVRHVLDVLVDPQRGTIAARDRLELPAGREEVLFTLHKGLDPRIVEGEGSLEDLGGRGHLRTYRLRTRDDGPVTLRYGGHIRHGLEEVREGMGRLRQRTRGTIDPEGVVLDGYSGWYPHVEDALHRFALQVQLPPGWSAVSQGEGPRQTQKDDGSRLTWRETRPQDEIYLIAGRFHHYRLPTPYGEAQVYLRSADDALAGRYLEATGRYLQLYSDLIGPYPYGKFALVENFWETGYGMPSFTLLGPRVLRLPFILHTSYPHEVLHNWWGNGVYVDYAGGNWSEGLTAYLSDHLMKEQRGQGAEYRRNTLRAYADYVREDTDFPIRAFRGRHGSASQAIGYGKTLMTLHMLRRQLGDGTFIEGLRQFYRDNLFKTAGFDDLRLAFERAGGGELHDYFTQWTERTGAPEISLSDVATRNAEDGFRLTGRLAQVQEDPPFPLAVPLVVHLEDGRTVEHRVPLLERGADFALDVPARPLRVAADPRFDLFRHLEPAESPATLSALFGAERGLIVLPDDDTADGYRALANAWAKGAGDWEIVEDGRLAALPEDRPVWLLGWSNRFLAAFADGQDRFSLDRAARSLRLGGDRHEGEGTSAVLARKWGEHAIGWIGAGNPAALPGLARKLPHYGKYSYLVFEGKAPDNRLKGQWPADDSSLVVWLTDDRPEVTLEPLPPLRAE